MYSSIKSYVKISGKCSKLFLCSRGLRQGLNLSPLLFSLYLNDLEHFITTRNDKIIEIYDADLDILVKMLVLLYADDTVIFATSEENLVSVLNTFYSYCCQWKLDINYDKTKFIVFGDNMKRKRNIKIHEYLLEIVDYFKYLGVMFLKKQTIFLSKKACSNFQCECAKCRLQKFSSDKTLDLSDYLDLKNLDFRHIVT